MLGELEQKIMDVIWSAKKPLKPAEVQKQLADELAYTTVMTVMKRLSDKRILKRKRAGKVFFYEPVKCKEEYASNNLNDHYNKILASFGDLAISHFVDTVEGNPQDLRLLKKYLDEKIKQQHS